MVNLNYIKGGLLLTGIPLTIGIIMEGLRDDNRRIMLEARRET